MKCFLAVVLASCLFVHAHGQAENPKYDKHLADSLGANEMGMKNYMMVILKTGPAKIAPGPARDSIFRGHFSNMKTMADAGKLIIAGPIGQNEKTYRGLYIFNVDNLEEAKKLAQTDPAVQAGIFDVEIYPWFGSAALPMYLYYSDKVTKKPAF
ncbi:MAG: YciI family protein [Chitinophagaceae bacterium]|nr:YciI family protein [Chitinophagaceae bacterium]